VEPHFDLTAIGRLCALIPPPRFHLIRYAGVLASHSKHRAEVVPGHAPPPVKQRIAEQLPLFAPSDLLRPVAEARHEPTKSRYPFGYHEARHPSRHAWALLMLHVFAKDVLECEHCQGRLRVIEVAKTPEAIARVLAHPFGCHTPSGVTKRVEARRAGLGPRPPPRPPRAPPLQLSLLLG
jgi:hypothetical protein